MVHSHLAHSERRAECTKSAADGACFESQIERNNSMNHTDSRSKSPREECKHRFSLHPRGRRLRTRGTLCCAERFFARDTRRMARHGGCLSSLGGCLIKLVFFAVAATAFMWAVM